MVSLCPIVVGDLKVAELSKHQFEAANSVSSPRSAHLPLVVQVVEVLPHPGFGALALDVRSLRSSYGTGAQRQHLPSPRTRIVQLWSSTPQM